jgi:hypothetical protein
MVSISERVRRRVRVEFPQHPNLVVAALTELTYDVFPSEARDSVYVERIQLAALLLARGDLRRLDDALVLGHTDWRDLLVNAGLADDGWRERVDSELAPTMDK